MGGEDQGRVGGTGMSQVAKTKVVSRAIVLGRVNHRRNYTESAICSITITCFGLL